MSKRFLISESEIADIKKMYGILNEDNFLTDMVKNVFNSAAGGSTDTTNTENIIKNIFSGEKSSEKTDSETSQTSTTSTTSTTQPNKLLFPDATKLIIDNIEGGYYNPKWHFKPAMGDSGETMFGIDRKHGGTLNTDSAGVEFWNEIDKNKSNSVWKHGFKGGALKDKLIGLVSKIMEPHYERLFNKYLTPESKKIVESSKPLQFHFMYASWNGSGFFKKFAESINNAVSQGITSVDKLKDIALQSRRNSGVSRSVEKIQKIFNQLS